MQRLPLTPHGSFKRKKLGTQLTKAQKGVGIIIALDLSNESLKDGERRGIELVALCEPLEKLGGDAPERSRTFIAQLWPSSKDCSQTGEAREVLRGRLKVSRQRQHLLCAIGALHAKQSVTDFLQARLLQ